MLSPISMDTLKPIPLKQLPTSIALKDSIVKDIGAGLGIGLVYIKNAGYFWAHAGGTLGYESFFIYNPENDFALCIMYNIKPLKQLIFAEMAYDLLSKIAFSQN